MDTKRITSDKEHKLILAIALMAFIFSIVGSAIYSIKADYARTEYFREYEEKLARHEIVFSGPYCHPDPHPDFLFSIILLVGSTFTLLCFTKIYFLSFLLTVGSLTRFSDWYNDTQKSVNYFDSEFISGINRYFYNASNFDLAVCLLFSILLFWQISILLRMLIKSLQRNLILP